MIRLLQFFFLFSIMLMSSNAFGQFTYVKGALDYSSIRFAKGGPLEDNTNLRLIRLNVGAMYQPLRFLAVGVDYALPINQSSSFSFGKSRTSEGTDFRTFDQYSNRRYATGNFSYDFKSSAALALHLRLIEPTSGLYLKLGLSFFSIEESFVLQRREVAATLFPTEAGSIPAVNLSYEETHDQLGFLLGVGWMKRFEGNVFIDINADLVTTRFSADSFSYDVPFRWEFIDDKHELVELEGQANGTKLLFSFGFGVGYFF
ncbi:MAG: hypothetical protein WBG42_06520 [Cryomorphaceae bacterium]